jgi:putative sterol carrier protein
MAVAADLGEMNGRLQTTLPQMKLQDASDVMQAFYPLVFEGMIELTNTDQGLRQKLKTVEDVVYLLSVPDVAFGLCLILAGGKFSYLFGKPERADVTMKTSPDALVRIMTGQTDALEAFMAGEVEVEGSLIKARGLRYIFETLGDKFGFRLMEFSA